ncbi:hypothetical protein [Oceanobacillus kimchii]
MIKKGDCMKKAALFTTLYVPNISEAWLSIEGLLPEITFGSSSIALAPS